MQRELGAWSLHRVSPDGPAFVVQVELGHHTHQVHVGFMESVDGANITPIVLVVLGGTGHQIVLEVVDNGIGGIDEGGHDVSAHVVFGFLFLGIGIEHVDERLRGEDVIAH